MEEPINEPISVTLKLASGFVDAYLDDEPDAVASFDIEAAGYHYADECPECPELHVEAGGHTVSDEVERWHDDESGHGGVFRFCYESSCKQVREAVMR